MFKLQSLATMAGLVMLFALVANALFGLFGALLVLVIAAALNWFSMRNAACLILRLHRARPLERWETPQILELTERLAARARIPVPRLMVYPSATPNAFALGLGEAGVVALSTRLLQLLDLREAAGVIAHELAHLKNRDGRLNLAAGLFVRAISTASQFLGISLILIWLAGSMEMIDAEALPHLLLVVGAPTAAGLLHAALMRTRERLADRDAAALTGDARGLASALHKLQRYGEYLDRWHRRFRFIYTADRERGPRLLHTHPPTAERVRELLQLEEGGSGQLDRAMKMPVRQIRPAASNPGRGWGGGWRLAG